MTKEFCAQKAFLNALGSHAQGENAAHTHKDIIVQQFSSTDPIAIEDIEAALYQVSCLAEQYPEDRDAYICYFERLERELAAAHAKINSFERMRKTAMRGAGRAHIFQTRSDHDGGLKHILSR